MGNKDGFITLNLLLLVLMITMIVSSVCFLISSSLNHTQAYKRGYEKDQHVRELFSEIEMEFQNLIFENDDFYNSPVITLIERKYEDKNLAIRDCSSGINEAFFKKDFLDIPETRKLIDGGNKDYIVNYGWINSEWNDSDYVANLLSKGINLNLPVINKMPLINVYYCPKEVIDAVLNYCNISNSEEKRNEFYNLITEGNFSKPNVINVFQIKEDTNLFNILGTKTSFWSVSFVAEGRTGKGVIAAIPDEEGAVKEYRGIEFSIEKNE